MTPRPIHKRSLLGWRPSPSVIRRALPCMAAALLGTSVDSEVGFAAERRTPRERRETLFAHAPAWRIKRREKLRQWLMTRRNTSHPGLVRDRWRWAALLDSGEPELIKRANAGLRDEKRGYGTGSFYLVELLTAEKLYGDLLEEATREQIRDFVTWALANPTQGIYGWANWLKSPEKIDHLFGSQCYYTAAVGVLGGEVLGDPKLLEAGRQLLRRLTVIRSNYGEDDEYNSYTYTAHGLTQMAPLCDLADDPESRLLARWLFARRMLVTLSRFHPPSGQVAGPNSRGYADGQMGTGPLNLSLHDAVIPGGVVHDIRVGERVNGGYTAGRQLRWCSTWDIPDYGLRIGTHKPYPYEVFSTVRDHGWNWKRADGTRRVLRKGKDDLTTYLTRDYTLATSADICGYQPSGNHFIAHWPLAEQVKSLADLRILWTWYARDDQCPFVKKLVMRRGGIFRTVQHRNRVLALYQPKENITYNAGQVLNTDALRLAFVLSAFRPVEELWIGDRRVDMAKLPFAHPRVEPMFLSDGSVYAAVLPLEVTDLGRDAAVRVTFNKDYRQVTVSYYNYRGAKREFGWDELPRIRNGFAFEIASKDEYADLAAFRTHMTKASVTDAMQEAVRAATFSSAGTTLKLGYDAVAAGSETRFVPYTRDDTAFVTRQINGRAIDHSYFRSTCAILSPEARISLGNATLTHRPEVPVWLIKDPTCENYGVWNFSGVVISLDLQTPQGKVSVKQFHLGRLLLRGGDEPVLEVEELPDGKAAVVPGKEWADLQVERLGIPGM